MKVNVQIDVNQKEIEVIIKTPEMNETVNDILGKLSDDKPKILVGFLDDKVRILDENSIIRIYTTNKKVFAVTTTNDYLIKIPLYEVLERLNQNQFVRISNTEIVNLKEVIEFDLSFMGTICIKLTNGDTSYVSRRYVSQIKQTLGIGGKWNEN